MADRDKAQQVATDAANDVRDALRSFLGRGVGADTVTNLIASIVAASVTLVVAILSAIFLIGADIVALFLETLESAREQNFDAINKVIAAAMGDLLSIDINPADLPRPGEGSAQVDRVQKLGAALHDTFYAVLGAGDPGEIGPGERAARALTGFNLSYAANAALTAIIPEMESLGFFKEFSQIGEEIGSSIALGRILRIAVKPLFDAFISTPLKQEMAAKFPRELLPVASLVQMFNAGLLDDDPFNQQMHAHGFSDDNIARLISVHTKPVQLPTLERALASGLIVKGIALANLQAQGYSLETAELLLQSLTLQRQDSLRGNVVSDAFAMARDRHMSDTEFKTVLDSIQVPQDEQALWMQRLTLYLDHPHKRLSIGEIIYLLERNQLTSDYLHQWAIDSGYSEDDAFTLEVYADLKDAEYEAKLKAAADKKKAADAKKALKG
jgi:hypothetical protein